jgi:hypothetical protein
VGCKPGSGGPVGGVEAGHHQGGELIQAALERV